MPNSKGDLERGNPSNKQPENGAKSTSFKYTNDKGKLIIEADTSNKTAMRLIMADFILKWIFKIVVALTAFVTSLKLGSIAALILSG